MKVELEANRRRMADSNQTLKSTLKHYGLILKLIEELFGIKSLPDRNAKTRALEIA
jgi:hypothetical protein